MTYAVKLQVTSVEGIGMFAKNEEELVQKVSTMSPKEKKEIYELISIMLYNEQMGTSFPTFECFLEYEKQYAVEVYNNHSNTNFTSFEEVLKDVNEKSEIPITEEEFLNGMGFLVPPNPNEIDNDALCDGILDLFQDKSTGEIISTYEIISPEGEWSDIYFATENGMYEFTVKDILTGETYKKSVEITNIDKNIPVPYYVDCEISNGEYTTIFLKDRLTSTKEKFENAYVMYKGMKIGISSKICGGNSDDPNYINGWSLADALGSCGFGKNVSFQYKDVEVILVKDGVEYKGTVNIGNVAR